MKIPRRYRLIVRLTGIISALVGLLFTKKGLVVPRWEFVVLMSIASTCILFLKLPTWEKKQE